MQNTIKLEKKTPGIRNSVLNVSVLFLFVGGGVLGGWVAGEKD